MKQIRFAILGSGFMGSTHAEAVRRLPDDAILVAVTGGSRAAGLAERFRIDCEPSTASLLARDDIDAIIITTPHHVHVQEASQALEAGKHVLVEKPLATTAADCERLIELAKSHQRTLSVGYQQRFRRNNAKAFELVTAGVIGRVLTIQVSMPMYAGAIKSGGFGGNWDWWNRPESVGHLLNSAPHAIDMMRWLTGGEVVTVSAFCRTFLPDIPVEDTTMALLELSTGTLCSLFSSRALPAPAFAGEDFRFRITGSAGLLDLDPYGELRLSETDGWRVVSTQPPVGHEGAATAFGDVRMQAYRDQIAAFIDAIHGRRSVIGTGTDGRAGVEACIAMLDSSADKRWVQINRGRE